MSFAEYVCHFFGKAGYRLNSILEFFNDPRHEEEEVYSFLEEEFADIYFRYQLFLSDNGLKESEEHDDFI